MGIPLSQAIGSEVVYWLADHVHDSAKRASAYGSGDRSTLVDGFHAADHAVGRLHGNTTNTAFSEMLLHFQNHVDGRGHDEAVADHAQGLINGRHRALR